MTARSTAAFLLAAAAALPSVAPAAPLDLGRADRKAGSLAGGRFTPGRPPATHFGGEEPFTCPSRGAQALLQDELVDLSRTSKRAPPQPDGRLCAAAEALLGWETREAPRPGIASFLEQYFGAVGFYARAEVLLLNAKDTEPKELAVQLVETVGNYGLNAKRARYGMMSQRTGKNSHRAAVVLLDPPPMVLEAVPRRLAAGESARIAGKLTEDHDRPQVLISDAQGKLTVVEPVPGAAFEATARCGERPGTIRVEIRGELGGAPALLARFPIACGLPLEASVAAAAPEPWSGDEAAQARKMVEFMNGERTAVGLPPLAWDEALAGVARGVADSIRAAVARGAFEVPGDLVARLKKVGIASTVVLQNPSQGRSPQEVMEQMSTSPGHRASYMDPSVNTAGVGLVSVADADGKPMVFVDQLFIKELPPVDLEAVRTQLRAAVGQKRRDARAAPAASEAALESFAQGFARELAAAGGSLPKARQAELTATLDKGWKTVTLTFGAKQELLDFAEEPEVTSPGRSFGVGVAQGMHPTLGRNALYAVIVVAQERGGEADAKAAGKPAGKKKRP